MKIIQFRTKILTLAMITAFFTISSCTFLPVSEAHVLVIGDSKSDFNQAYSETTALSADLKSRGYEVFELYRSNATAKNILKGMYGADAVIYAGHGGYQTGNYDNNGGTASPPFALVGSDDFIWAIGDKMREGWSGNLFTAPFKQNIPVILLHACFSTGWVENKEVANPIETLYNFARMFTGAGANYYATTWNGAEIVYDFLNGAVDFTDANNQNYEKITSSTMYNGIPIWRNAHGYSAFIGDWSGKFPSVAQTTLYDDAAAEKWYNSDRSIGYIESYPNVVWQDYRDGTPHIYYKNLNTGQNGRVTGYNSNQETPAVSGSIIVWSDNRDVTSHIYYKKLDSGQNGKVTGYNSNQLNPAISGNIIVWEDFREGTSHIYYKNLVTGQNGRVTGFNSQQENPSISGNLVVWQDYRGITPGIYYKDLGTGIWGRVTGYNSLQLNPSVSGSTVVWEDNRDGSNQHIYYKRLNTGQNGRVTGYDSNQTNPSVSGSTVVWEDNRDGSNQHIYYKKLDTGQNGKVTGYNSNQESTAISGSTVVWEDNRDGGNPQIYYKKLDTGQNGRVTGYNSNQCQPAIG